ncbi:MAG: histidine kinase [Gemmatimonadetes bacterium]|nr:histidine kinase [Gemmatimonadota bacterium]
MVNLSSLLNKNLSIPPPRHIALGLGAFVLLFAVVVSQTYVWIRWWRLRFTIAEAIVWSIPDLVLWGILIPVVVMGAKRFPLSRENLVTRIPAHLCASVVTALAALGLLYVSDLALHWSQALGAPGTLLSHPRFRYGFSIYPGIMIYWVVVSITQAMSYYDRFRERELAASRLETRLAKSKLEALKMELDPHFLFNTLNSISVLMKRDVATADKMLSNLSGLLRYVVQGRETHEVTLEEELNFLKRYLDIQKIRFSDRLTVEYSVDNDVLDALLPNLILQPIIENSIVHGITQVPGDGRITFCATKKGEKLMIQVTDNGPGLGLRKSDGSGGIGVANTRARLEQMYGVHQRFELETREEGGARVSIEIPYKRRSEIENSQEHTA